MRVEEKGITFELCWDEGCLERDCFDKGRFGEVSFEEVCFRGEHWGVTCCG